MKTLAFAFAALWVVAPPAWGETATSRNNPEARRHFEEGLQSAQRGDLKKSLIEFEAAYTVQPNFTVLYNIGQAHSALGHPVEAVTMFERSLAEGGEHVSPSRREEVEAIIATNRQRIGLLHIVMDATVQARVWVDGSEVVGELLANPLPLAEGRHSILYVENGCSPVSLAQSVLAGKAVDVEFPRATDCVKPLAQLAIDCEVPDVEVEVVGLTKARTPLDAPLLVPAGNVVIHFRRPGYASVARQLQLGQNTITRVACGQRTLQPLPPGVGARLVIQKSPENAQVLVDGQPFAGGILPAGPHDVVVERYGFVPTRRLISLEATKTRAFSATLTKTPEHVARDQASASRRRNCGLVLGGAAGALLGSAVGLYAWNSQRYTDWRDMAARSNGQAALATSIQRVDDLSLALALLGIGLGGAGAWLSFGPE